jgi:Uncharacterized oxidoreductase dhs-27
MDIPVTPTQITSEWLTPALRKAGVLEDQVVRSVGVEPLHTGQGFTSRLVRLCLEYDVPAPGAPASLIAKFPSPVTEVRAAVSELGFYEREASFYRLFSGSTGLRVPCCYFSAYDPADGASLLLLEDLERLCVGRTVLGSTPPEAELVIRAIASLHVAWWDRPELAEFQWLYQFDALVFREPPPGYPESWQRVCRHLGDSLPAAFLPVGERLGNAQPFLDSQLARPPWTIVHNDYMMDNLFFDESNGGMELVVADWQMVARARAPFDVAVFLGSSVSTADRRAYEERWLAHYYRLLLEGGVQDYRFEQCLYDYRIALLARLGVWINVLGSPQVTSEEHLRDWRDVVVRLAAAVVDHDAGSLLPG